VWYTLVRKNKLLRPKHLYFAIKSDEGREIYKHWHQLSNRGPLYGIPISVKECFFIKGYDSTAGKRDTLKGQPHIHYALILVPSVQGE